MADDDYEVPEVWTHDTGDGDHKFAAINQPTSGARFEHELPRGEHPFQLYSLGTPNGQKVTIMFEELLAAGHSDAEYDAWLINILEGEQFGSGFVGINPNSKIPALLDCSGDEPFRVFESGAILLHLAEKFGAFIPSGGAARAECLSWLSWQLGSAPYIGGGFGHFYRYAPMRFKYAIDRFSMETKRLFDVADQRLGEAEWFAGDEYTIADMAIFGWFHYFVDNDAYQGGTKFLGIRDYENVVRWNDAMMARMPVRRGIKVNLDGEVKVKERHSAADIDAVMS